MDDLKSKPVIVTGVTLRDEAVLVRFPNPDGTPYSCIYLNGRPQVYQKTDDEPTLIDWWNLKSPEQGEGSAAFVSEAVNESTVMLLTWLESIRERSKAGIIPYSEATGREPGHPVYYDDAAPRSRDDLISRFYPVIDDSAAFIHDDWKPDHKDLHVWEGWMFGCETGPVVRISPETGKAVFFWPFANFDIEISDGRINFVPNM